MVDDMSADARVSFARSSAEVNDPAAVPVLICMCYDPEVAVALAAMDAVERYRDARALPALRELARHHPQEQIRDEAQKVVDRLGVRVQLAPQVQPAEIEPLHASYLTTIDGAGEQAAVFVRSLLPSNLPTMLEGVTAQNPAASSEYLRLVQVAFDDQTGIEQCFGLDVHRDDLEELLGELGAQGLIPVRVPYDQALEQLTRACEWTWQAGRAPPLSFVAWREWICGASWADRQDASQNAASLAPDISANLHGWLYVTCYALFYQDEFADWSLSTAAVDPIGAEYLRLIQEHGDPLNEDVLRALLRRGVEQTVHPELRRLLQARLLRIAPLLRELYEEEDVWRWAVVAADTLGEDSPYSWQEHPFLMGLVGQSLAFALDRDIDWTVAL
jgi:hypothetical protein